MHRNEIMNHLMNRMEKVRQELNRKGNLNLHDPVTYKKSIEMDHLILAFLKVQINLVEEENQVSKVSSF